MKKRKNESQGVRGGRGAALRTMSAPDQEQAAPEKKPQRREAKSAEKETRRPRAEKITICVSQENMALVNAFSERNFTTPRTMLRRIVEQWIEEHQDFIRK